MNSVWILKLFLLLKNLNFMVCDNMERVIFKKDKITSISLHEDCSTERNDFPGKGSIECDNECDCVVRLHTFLKIETEDIPGNVSLLYTDEDDSTIFYEHNIPNFDSSQTIIDFDKTRVNEWINTKPQRELKFRRVIKYPKRNAKKCYLPEKTYTLLYKRYDTERNVTYNNDTCYHYVQQNETDNEEKIKHDELGLMNTGLTCFISNQFALN